MLLKENKEAKERCRALVFENEEQKQRIGMFEKELEELQIEVKHMNIKQ